MPTVLAIMAHPDDIEITCAGTLVLLQRSGWTVHMATMTAGDLGSARHGAAAITRIRRREAAASARIIGATYTCLAFADLTIACDERSKRRVSGLLRETRPDLVITHPPIDYMADHEETSRAVREASFACTMPNWKAAWTGRSRGRARGRGGPAPCDTVPALLYADPIDQVDYFGRRVPASRLVDISAVIEVKAQMLAAHASQREWLRAQHGEDEYLNWMRRLGAGRGREFGPPAVEYAEGFVRHLGHGFPKDDVLVQALGCARVRSRRDAP